MNKKIGITAIISVQLILILVQIHKSSMMAHATYRGQSLERAKKQQQQAKQELIYKLNMAKARAEIKTYATAQLGMQPLLLNQIKTLESA